MFLSRIRALAILLFVVPACWAAPKPIYASWIPATTSLKAGSKPSIRVTLSETPTSPMNLDVTASDTAAVGLPSTTIPVTVGNRYVTIPVTLNGVDQDESVNVTFSANGVSATTPNLTIVAAKFIRLTINSTPVNTIASGATVEVKYTLDGPAGPGGYTVFSSVGSLEIGSNINQFLAFITAYRTSGAARGTVPYGQGILRLSFTSPTFAESQSIKILSGGYSATNVFTPNAFYPVSLVGSN